jgi:hypothetical protein
MRWDLSVVKRYGWTADSLLSQTQQTTSRQEAQHIGGNFLYSTMNWIITTWSVLHVYIGAGSPIHDRSSGLVKQTTYGVGLGLKSSNSTPIRFRNTKIRP